MLYTRHNFEVADFCDTRGIRPERAGILVKPDGTAATDNYVLLEVSSPSPDNAEKNFPVIPGHAVKARNDQFIFPKEAARQVLKTIPKKTDSGSGVVQRAAVLATDDGFAGFVAGDPVHIRPTIAKEIEGTFPEYQQLFPTANPISVVSVNAKYLEKLAKFFAGLSELGNVTIKTYGAQDPSEVAPTTFSRSLGSTASAKNAWPPNSGEPAAVASDFQVVPPSSLRIGPTPRYAGNAFTRRFVNIE